MSFPFVVSMLFPKFRLGYIKMPEKSIICIIEYNMYYRVLYVFINPESNLTDIMFF